ncbi:MAG: replication-relaxation family protein [Anaerolineales bacterium]
MRDHLRTTAMGRRLLDRIGVFPLVNATDLAFILGLDAGNVRREISRLRHMGLIAHPVYDEAGYGLAWRGLTLLALQAGYLHRPYAELRRWPVMADERGPRYSLEAALRVREHTEIVIEFLVGLRRAAERERLALRRWEHMQLMEESPSDGRETATVRVLHDAEGCVRSFGTTLEHYADTLFWLEVDRGTLNGRALQDKLIRYYRLRSDTPGVRGRPERLLIVVERDDEGRLQSLCRRLRTLDEPITPGSMCG